MGGSGNARFRDRSLSSTTAMDAKVPEEILCKILSYNISISSVDFLRYVECWEHSRVSRCCHLLLVSKRWLRIGTPLLYEFVWLSRPEHTASVATLLRADPHVGKAIRCLKLEGGLGKDLVHIAKLAPKLQSVYISLRIKSAESITGLKKAFPILKPVNLYIKEYIYRDNKKSTEARTLLYAHIQNKWTSLVSLELIISFPKASLIGLPPQRSVTFSDWHRNMDDPLASALGDSSIEELVLQASDADDWIHSGHMRRVLQNPHLQRVVCRGITSERTTRKLLQQVHIPDADAQKFTFVHDGATDNIM